MKTKSNQEIYEDIIIPVLGNVVNVYQSLSVFDAVSQKVEEIDETKFKRFFNYTQKVSLHYSILCLCRLFEKDPRAFTIFRLLRKTEDDISGDAFPLLDQLLLKCIEFPSNIISILSNPSSNASVRKRKFLCALRGSNWISKEKNKFLDICFTLRNTKIAHLEDLNFSGRNLPSHYPSSEQIKWQADRAYDVCCLAMDIYGVPRLYMPTWAKGIRGNTLGVIKRVLDVDFKTNDELIQFYRGR